MDDEDSYVSHLHPRKKVLIGSRVEAHRLGRKIMAETDNGIVRILIGQVLQRLASWYPVQGETLSASVEFFKLHWTVVELTMAWYTAFQNHLHCLPAREGPSQGCEI